MFPSFFHSNNSCSFGFLLRCICSFVRILPKERQWHYVCKFDVFFVSMCVSSVFKRDTSCHRLDNHPKSTPQAIKPLDRGEILLVGFPCQHKLLINDKVSILTAIGRYMQSLYTMALCRGWKALHNVYNKVWRVAWQRNVHNETALWRCSFCQIRAEKAPIVLIWFSFLGLLTPVKWGSNATTIP